jgi:hypothetical protein
LDNKKVRVIPIEEIDYPKIQRYLLAEERSLQIGYVCPPLLQELKKLYPIGEAYKFESCDKLKGAVRVFDGSGMFCSLGLTFLSIDTDWIEVVFEQIKRMATSRNQQWITIREIPGYSKEVIERLRGFGFEISSSYGLLI